MHLLLPLLLACGGKTGETYGQAPSAPVVVPDFTATAHDGELRTRADLLGKPTVMWFYPAAATFG